MSTAEITKIDEYTTHYIHMNEIFMDDDFNCRGKIAPIDVVELAKSINELGLQQPISLQPYNNPAYPGKKYRIVAGHRRFIAFKVNKQDKIPAMIKTGLDDLQARVLNLTENLKRQDLNILQEATALIPFERAGWTEGEISKRVGMSRGWTQVRLMLLRMEPEIQAEAAAGILTQENIRNLYTVKDPTERFELIKKIKERKERGEKLPKIVKQKPYEKKIRAEEELFALQDHIQRQVGNNIVTRVLGWAGGAINNLEVHQDLKQYFEHLGKTYNIPEDILKGI